LNPKKGKIIKQIGKNLKQFFLPPPSPTHNIMTPPVLGSVQTIAHHTAILLMPPTRSIASAASLTRKPFMPAPAVSPCLA